MPACKDVDAFTVVRDYVTSATPQVGAFLLGGRLEHSRVLLTAFLYFSQPKLSRIAGGWIMSYPFHRLIAEKEDTP